MVFRSPFLLQRTLKAVDRVVGRTNWQRGVVLPNENIIMMSPSKFTPKGQINFKVPLHYNKYQIKNYLEEIYKVKVKSVNTAIYLGKKKRTPKYFRLYKERDWKKAMVILEDDEAPFTFPTFEEIQKMSS